MDPKPPDRVVDGRYRLLHRVGRGELAVVWTAEDEVLGRVVAVKQVIPPAHLGEDERRRVQQRILRGAHTAARLDTPFAASVYDVVAEGSTSWIVMERFEAPSLDEVLRRSGPLSLAETTAIGMALLDALRVAHAAEVVHRDVQPANVMLTYRGAVLTDFGLAAPDGDLVPAPGTPLGARSAPFAAPEWVRGQPAGPAADVWSAGATLYAAVEGRSPFERGGQLATMHAVLQDDPPAPRRAGPLAPLLLMLLSKDSAARPTAAQARERLALLRSSARVGAERDGAAQRVAGRSHDRSAVRRLAAARSAVTSRGVAHLLGRRHTPALAGAIGAAVLVAVLGAATVTLLPDIGDADPGASQPRAEGAAGGRADRDSAGGTGDTRTGERARAEADAGPPPAARPPVVPTPFASASLYEFSRYLFDPDECVVPRPGDFPIAEIEPDAELVKCQDAPYSGTFWCKTDAAGLAAEREIYLSRSRAGTRQPLTGPPAGRAEAVDGIPVAYNHGLLNGARVFWDSPAALCGAELQAGSDDLAATVEHWRAGQPL